MPRGQDVLRDIAVGEEFTFDYTTCLTADFGDMDCSCGAANCWERVTGGDWKLPQLQEGYRGYFQPYIEAKIVQNYAPHQNHTQRKRD
jgi:hypothetical protein